nr:serine/threonine-protein phosphatase 7 long form homolog [Ipomoea batatas]
MAHWEKPTTIDAYRDWFYRYDRRLIGNPNHNPNEGYLQSDVISCTPLDDSIHNRRPDLRRQHEHRRGQPKHGRRRMRVINAARQEEVDTDDDVAYTMAMDIGSQYSTFANSKRKATEEGETSIAKEPRTNSAPEQAEEQAQQLTQEHADQRQVEPIQSPEQNDNTKQESEDESEEDGSGQSNDGELHIKVPTNKNNQKRRPA